MSRIWLFSLMIALWCTMGYSQRHELGVTFGGVNYIGEIGGTQYFQPRHLSYGFIYRRNLTPRIALRAQFSTGKLSANDLNATELDRVSRGLSFSNNYSAWGAGVEVSYIAFPIGDFGASWTPYLHLGVQRMVIDELYFAPYKKTAWSHGREMTVSVPFGVGVKFNVGQAWVISAELQPQFTLSDNIDGSYPNYEKQPDAQKFSTSLSSDWLVFSGISITYAFGRLPCCRE